MTEKFSDSDEIYRLLVEDSDEDWIYGLVAFAIIEEQRIEWLQHIREHNGKAPTKKETERWYQQLPPGALLRAKGDAENALSAYSGEAIDEAVETARKEILESSIIQEIRLNRRFLPQFGINVLSGLSSAILFTAILVLIATFVLADLSPVKLWQNEFGNKVEENEDGKKTLK